MGNFMLIEPSLSDLALDAYFIGGAGGELAAAPASNLLLRQPKELFETVNAGSQLEVRFDLGASVLPVSYDFIALLFSNATNAATVTWDGDDNVNFASPNWTSGSVTFRAAGMANYRRKHGFFLVGSTRTDRYVRCRFTDTANPDGVYRFGRFYCGKGYRPTLNVEYGLTFGFDDEAPTTTTSAGERITRANEPIPVLTFTLSAHGPTAKDDFYTNLHELLRRRGAAKDVIAIIDPEDASYAGPMLYYGTLQQRTQIELPAHEFYSASFELRGLI